ncbi:S-adenosylmethionine:tRNA ribosyltransferase-isomerase [Pseudochryseolinea flava]|uniref:S-adenosylmethionine:tRNA ribosyltransferase-isomerase n=1 Tax=Pseudochryseolinea flava TaxID=2059302 RepID=A0A364XY53_9BACT|nr:S-adenosylmethionine:tRNA ribosyltransferase-isomerase [Pseudochryseolinea flava]RAV99187.1 S-adenosylmethionine:tRNA ribosyltransferase-isomerase [Pseudochryseolinea flava]
MKPQLFIKDYTYDLPHERIAKFPLEKRDDSKLLVYQAGQIEHAAFRNILDFLPSNSFLVFNDTKVIPARLHFTKETGASIETFLLHPLLPSTLVVEAMIAHPSATWQCTIGNLKKWTTGTILQKKLGSTTLEAHLIDREKGVVEFRWNSSQSFAEIVSLSGETPLPPYLKRDVESSDKERYQTVYAHHDGAVAAPTAGLHFTDKILSAIQQQKMSTDFVTLHVSAGTFQPVKAEVASEHTMHEEQIIVRRETIINLLKANHFIVPVGTTAMRTLESLYWFGVRLLNDPAASFSIHQDEPYTIKQSATRTQILERILQQMDKKGIDMLTGETSIFIMPGYQFRMCDGLITNFHQPGSTLILLVAALVGDDWKKIYHEAMTNDYRFLSYGDSSLLLPSISS